MGKHTLSRLQEGKFCVLHELFGTFSKNASYTIFKTNLEHGLWSAAEYSHLSQQLTFSYSLKSDKRGGKKSHHPSGFPMNIWVQTHCTVHHTQKGIASRSLSGPGLSALEGWGKAVPARLLAAVKSGGRVLTELLARARPQHCPPCKSVPGTMLFVHSRHFWSESQEYKKHKVRQNIIFTLQAGHSTETYASDIY